MKNFALKDIAPQGYFSKAIYLDSQFILNAPEMRISAEMLKAADEWGFRELLSDGEPCENYVPKAADDEEHLVADRSTMADREKVQQAETFYASFLKYVKTLYAFLPVRNELDFKNLAEEMRTVCDYVKANHRYLLRTQLLTSPVPGENQIVSHTTRSTLIAIIIGANLKLQNFKLIELGVASLVHEIGMIKLPQQGYQENRELTDQERKLLLAHPILGFNLLKGFNFPLVICLAALEHHERENGTGYPQRKTSDKISLYSKIIAVACSYEAILSSRPHKDAKDGHTGIMEMLKNEGKQYDDAIVRALVYSLSLFPIGLYVLLSDGKKGQVIDVDPGNPRYPIVEIAGELMPNGKNKTLQTSAEGVSITRALSSSEVEIKQEKQ